MSFMPDKDYEVRFPIVSQFSNYSFNLHCQGDLFSLNDPESKQDNLSLNIAKEPSGELNLNQNFASSSPSCW